MHQGIKKQWLKALRSGEYTQTTCSLRRRDDCGTMSYCCLGVLTDIVRHHDKIKRQKKNLFDSCGGLLHPLVAKYTKLSEENLGVQEDLADLNDNQGQSFEQIANWIESNL